MITDFDCNVNEVCALLGSYTMQSGNYVSTLWNNLSVPSSRVHKSKKISWLSKMGLIGRPKTQIWNYNFMLCKISEGHRSNFQSLPKLLTNMFNVSFSLCLQKPEWSNNHVGGNSKILIGMKNYDWYQLHDYWCIILLKHSIRIIPWN
jgi:hypothetical protein